MLDAGRWEDGIGHGGKKWNQAREATLIGVEAWQELASGGLVAAHGGRQWGRKWATVLERGRGMSRVSMSEREVRGTHPYRG